MRAWRLILLFCLVLGSSSNAFAIRAVQPENPCTGDFGGTVSRARYYNPQIGRFWTMDTYEGEQQDPGSLHKYLYCRGNPVTRSDPSGRMDLASTLNTVGIIGLTATALYGGYAIGQSHAWQSLGNISYKAIRDALFATTISTASIAVAKTLDEVKVEVDEAVASLVAAGNNKVFIHATTTADWPDIVSAKSLTYNPNASKWPGILDFGAGFYTFQLNDPKSAVSAVQSAYNWVSGPTVHSVGVLAIFTMDNLTYEGLDKYEVTPGEKDLVKPDFSTGHELVYGEVSGTTGFSWQYKFEGRGAVELFKGFKAAIPLVK